MNQYFTKKQSQICVAELLNNPQIYQVTLWRGPDP